MTYRDDADEIATLRQELAVSEAACATAMAEVEALTADRDHAREEWHRHNVRADEWRHLASRQGEEIERLRTAVRSVLAMVDHGTALPALMHAVVELRRFVEPEVGT